MTYRMQHFFVCWFVMWTSSLVRCLLRFLAHLFISLFVFLLLSFKSSFAILANSPLPDVSFASFFSQSEAHLLIHLTLSSPEHRFLILMSFHGTLHWPSHPGVPSLSYLIALAKTSSIMLTISGESGHLWLVSDLSGKPSSFPILRC